MKLECDAEMILSSEELTNYFEGLIDPGVQIQPNGVDLTAGKISEFDGKGSLDFDNKERKTPDLKEITLKNDWYYLKPGPYLVHLHEKVKIPTDCVALVLPRSSLMRMGVMLFTALYDSGYQGQGKALMVVFNPVGVQIKKNARVGQMIFIRCEKPAEKEYNGIYQNEKI